MEGSFEHRKEPAIYLPGISWLAVQALDSQEKNLLYEVSYFSLMMVVYVVFKYVSTFEAVVFGMKYKIALGTNWEDGTYYRTEF